MRAITHILAVDGGGTKTRAALLAADGPTRDGPTRDGPTRDGTTRDGATHDGAPRDGTTRDDAAHDGATHDGATRDDATRDDATHDGTTRDGTTRDDPIRDGTTRDGATHDGATHDGATHDGASREGKELAEHTGGPCNLFQDPESGLAEIRRLWHHLATSAGLDPKTAPAHTALSAGLAGANAPGSLARFRQAFADFATCHLSTDGYTTLLGATGGRPGGLLAIGTGVVGYRLHKDGQVQKLSGWGFPIGDRGSGAWLGWRAIGDWLEWRDGYPGQPESTLWPTLEATLGSTTSAILGWLKPARPADFAAFARAVVNAAAAGDQKGRALLDEAAGHHTRLAHAMAPTATEPLVLAGGLASVFRPAIKQALGPVLADAERTASPLDGARLIATGRNPAEFTD